LLVYSQSCVQCGDERSRSGVGGVKECGRVGEVRCECEGDDEVRQSSRSNTD
jgi:hypothetical protein